MLLEYLFVPITITFRLYENKRCRELFLSQENSACQAPLSRNNERAILLPCRHRALVLSFLNIIKNLVDLFIMKRIIFGCADVHSPTGSLGLSDFHVFATIEKQLR